jgi:methylisocitrate lyase
MIRVANMVETGKTPLLTPDELHDLGFDLIVSPLTNLYAATRAIAQALDLIRERGTLRDHLDMLTTFADFGDLVELSRHEALDQRYRDAGPASSEPAFGTTGGRPSVDRIR